MASVDAAHSVLTTGTADFLKPAFDKYDGHWHEYDAMTLVNRTGGGLVSGDVVALDPANDTSVVVSDVAGAYRQYVVATATIANTGTGEFARAGAVVAKSTGAIARRDYVRKSATSKSVESTGVSESTTSVPPPGTIGVAIVAASGGAVGLLLFWRPPTSRVLHQAAVSVVIANTTTLTTILSVTVPANTLGTSRRVRMRLMGFVTGRDLSGVAAQITLTWTILYGATTLLTVVQRASGSDFGASNSLARLNGAPVIWEVDLVGWGSTAVQRVYGVMTGAAIASGAENAAAFVAPPYLPSTTGSTDVYYWQEAQIATQPQRNGATVDSTIDQTLAVKGQWSEANAGNTVTIEHVELILVP